MIDGFSIGHHTADGDGWLTGTTVVLTAHGAVGGVDVRGGAPGTRETDLLDPRALVDRVDAVVLTGGSAYGLAAADGVLQALANDGRGLPVGPGPAETVPIVPAAVIFDLGRGGQFANRPTADFGIRAYQAAKASLVTPGGRTTADPTAADPPAADPLAADPEVGSVGAGTGAVAGGLKGGFGYAEADLAAVGGVPALVGRVGVALVVNAVGSGVDPQTGALWSDRSHRLPLPDERGRQRLAAAQTQPGQPLNTTIGAVLTDLKLTKAECSKLAAAAHDGLARAIRPAHLMTDGDTFFALASGRRSMSADPRERIGAFNQVLSLAADLVLDACFLALISARSLPIAHAYLDCAELAPDRAQ